MCSCLHLLNTVGTEKNQYLIKLPSTERKVLIRHLWRFGLYVSFSEITDIVGKRQHEIAFQYGCLHVFNVSAGRVSADTVVLIQKVKYSKF